LAKEKPPIFGMLQRGGEVVIRMLEDVKQMTIGPLIKRTIVEGSMVYTDEYDIYSRLVEWGYGHETVCHAAGEYARDDDGDGFCEVHVNTLEGFWSLLRSWLRPHRGIPPGELAAVPGVLRVRSQHPGSWQAAVGCPDRPLVGTTLQPILSLRALASRAIPRPTQSLSHKWLYAAFG